MRFFWYKAIRIALKCRASSKSQYMSDSSISMARGTIYYAMRLCNPFSGIVVVVGMCKSEC